MQVILDSLFARPDSAPIWGGKKGEFRDWTRVAHEEPAHRLDGTGSCQLNFTLDND